MNLKIGTEAAQFPEKEYINGIAVAVLDAMNNPRSYPATQTHSLNGNDALLSAMIMLILPESWQNLKQLQ